jgi:hypothetical protein
MASVTIAPADAAIAAVSETSETSRTAAVDPCLDAVTFHAFLRDPATGARLDSLLAEFAALDDAQLEADIAARAREDADDRDGAEGDELPGSLPVICGHAAAAVVVSVTYTHHVTSQGEVRCRTLTTSCDQ